MVTASFERRLQVLEAKAPKGPGPDAEAKALRLAASTLFDILEQHYPSDPWSAATKGPEGWLVHRTSSIKVEEAAQRLLAGAPTAADTTALDALAASDAMRSFGFTAQELVIFVGTEPAEPWARQMRSPS